MSRLIIPQLSLGANRIAHYAITESSGRRLLFPKPKKTEEDRSAEIAYRKVKRMTNALVYLLESSSKKRVFQKKNNQWFSFRNTFVTLTIPGDQKHTDADFHRLVFKPFMRFWKKREPGLLYVWKAEVQKRGSLHYHLVTNAFWHWKKLRNAWNYYCYKAGYTNSDNANSTDVHSLKGINDTAAYMLKYMTKSEAGKRKLEMKSWDCSIALKRVKNIIIELPCDIIKEECRILHQKFKSTKRYLYCIVQTFRPSWLRSLPKLGTLYRERISELIALNLKISPEYSI